MNFRFTKLLRTTVQGLQIAALFSDNANSTRYYHRLGSCKSLGEHSTGPCQITTPDICEEAERGQTHKTKTRKKEVSCLQRRHNSVKKIIIKQPVKDCRLRKEQKSKGNTLQPAFSDWSYVLKCLHRA